MIKSDSIANLAAALAAAQAKIEGASKDKANPFFKSKYADLASVWDACREPLSSNGLSVAQFPRYSEGVATITTILMHKSGEFMSDDLSAPVKEQTPQAIGSALTYLRRYSLSAVAGVAPEDDDGNAASGKSANGNGHNGNHQAFPTQAGKPQSLNRWKLIQDMADDYHFNRGEKDAALIDLTKKVTGGVAGKDLTDAHLVSMEKALAEATATKQPEDDIKF